MADYTTITKLAPIEMKSIGLANTDIPERTVVRLNGSGKVVIGASAAGEQVAGITDKAFKENDEVSVITRGQAFVVLTSDTIAAKGVLITADDTGKVIKYDSTAPHSYALGVALEAADASVTDKGILVDIEIIN